ncbi:MAG: hypothetical protein AAF911_06870 [Planctomycetota bacterium]
MNRAPDSPYLFVGGRSRVFALDKASGTIIWEVELKSGWFKTGNDFVTLSEGLDRLFAFTHGIAFCLDKYSGAIIWDQPINELKHHVASMTVDATVLGLAHGDMATDTATLGVEDGGDGDGGDGGGD